MPLKKGGSYGAFYLTTPIIVHAPAWRKLQGMETDLDSLMMQDKVVHD